MSIRELLQYRQGLFRNRVIYQTEEWVPFGSSDQVTMSTPSLAVWMQVGFRMPDDPQIMEPIND
jgi:hypothetical protein